MRFQFTVDGEALVDRTLLRWSDRVHNARPAFEAIADQFATAEMAHFASNGSGKWAALSPRYAAYKAARFPGRPTLVRAGDLRNTLTRRPLGVERIADNSLEVGTNDPKALFHQKGTPKMPARPVIKLNDRTKKQMAKTLQRYLATGAI